MSPLLRPVLVLALGIAVGSAALFDVSMALGAFLAGLVVGRSEYALRAASDAARNRAITHRNNAGSEAASTGNGPSESSTSRFLG